MLVHLLIVDDDVSLSEALAEALRLHGFDPECVGSGREALARAAGADVVLLDLSLPDLDGLEVCRRIREFSDVPVIVLSARGDELDRVLGLETGADDYLVKPFSSRELVARLHALVRRVDRSRAHPDGEDAAVAPAIVAETKGAIRFGTLTLDLRTRTVTVAGRCVELTVKEFDLLAVLLEDPGAVCRRESLMAQVWDANWFGPTKTLNVHVASLREKLGDAGWIETVRGVGFRAAVVA